MCIPAVGREVVLSGCCKEITQIISSDKNNFDKFVRDNSSNTKVWYEIEERESDAIARGLEIDVEVGTFTKEKVFLRGRYVYNLPEYEWAKSLQLIVGFPLITVVVKIIVPIASAIIDLTWCDAMPLRALVGLVAHPIISAIGLVPGFSNYFNKINGDLERWVNGHSDRNLEEASAAKRSKQKIYIALCQQPLFKLPDDFDCSEGINIDEMRNETVKNLALRLLAGSKFGSKKPWIVEK